jgi:hypothetical protein
VPVSQSADVQHGFVQKLTWPAAFQRSVGTTDESAQMSLSHAAAPLQGHVTPRQGPVSAGPVSAGAVVSGIEDASASMGIDESPGDASSSPVLASATMQSPDVGSHSSPEPQLATTHDAMHWCVLR